MRPFSTTSRIFDAKNEFVAFCKGFTATGENYVQADEGRVARESVDFVRVWQAGEGLVPVGIVKRIAVFGGDRVRTE